MERLALVEVFPRNTFFEHIMAINNHFVADLALELATNQTIENLDMHRQVRPCVGCHQSEGAKASYIPFQSVQPFRRYWKPPAQGILHDDRQFLSRVESTKAHEVRQFHLKVDDSA